RRVSRSDSTAVAPSAPSWPFDFGSVGSVMVGLLFRCAACGFASAESLRTRNRKRASFLLFLFLFRCEELAQLFQETLALRRHVLVVQLGQLAEQLFLALGQALGRFDDHLYQQIARPATAEIGHALA